MFVFVLISKDSSAKITDSDVTRVFSGTVPAESFSSLIIILQITRDLFFFFFNWKFCLIVWISRVIFHNHSAIDRWRNTRNYIRKPMKTVCQRISCAFKTQQTGVAAKTMDFEFWNTVHFRFSSIAFVKNIVISIRFIWNRGRKYPISRARYCTLKKAIYIYSLFVRN